MKIAIAGPDGAGKSSICKALAEQINPSVVIYAGKADFRFRSTAFALRFWDKARELGRMPSLLVQHFLYYPLEYFDNLSKFKVKPQDKATCIYDRHPIDRVMLKHVLLLRRRANKIGAINFYAQYPFCWFWGKFYKHFFPKIDAVFVVLPDPELCFERSGGQYGDFEEAQIRVNSYYLALAELDGSEQYRLLETDSKASVQAICSKILNEISN